MKTKKKLISILLTVSMMLTLFPFAAFAEEAGAPVASDKIIYVDANATGENTDGTAGNPYKTLQAAIDAANGATIIVLKSDLAENVSVATGKTITLDLNGFTLDGGHNNGSKAAIYNEGTVVIKDSSAAQNGTVKRSDNGNDGAYYTLHNEGTMTIESGKIYNNSGSAEKWQGSSLICNGGKNAATLTIIGGVLEQQNFIAVKNDELGTFNMSGGTVKSATQAVQNWAEATLSGGELTGNVVTWGYVDKGASKVGKMTIKENVIINGSAETAWHGAFSGKEVPSMEISGGTIKNVVNDNTGHGKIVVSGGKIESDVTEFLAPDYGQAADGTVGTLSKDNAVAMIGDTLYGKFDDAIAAANAAQGGTIELLKDVTIDTWTQVWNTKNLTIDGNGKTLTVGKIESKGNGNFLFYGAENLNVSDLTVNLPKEGYYNGFSMVSGKLEKVTVNGGVYAVATGKAPEGQRVEIKNCTFSDQSGMAIYTQENGLAANTVIDGCTFNSERAMILRNNEQFTNNTVKGVKGVTINKTATATVTNNTFTETARLKIYETDSKIEENKLLGEVVLDKAVPEKDSKISLNKNYWGENRTPASVLGEEAAAKVDGGNTNYYEAETMKPEDLNTYQPSTGGGVVTRYDVTLADTDNGTITATHKRASKNSTVTITATPDEGYAVDAVTVTDKDGDKVAVTKKDDNKYTFKMPASDVTVKATFVKDGAQQPEQPSGLPFTDVAKDAWYFPAVEYVFNNGLMNGTTATTFAPNVELNRAMMAAVLYNMEGKPACDKSGIFSDVENGKWYTEAINWAASNNIVSGMPDGTYAPNQALTREQMASILYRYAEYKGIKTDARADLGKFTDGTTTSAWATDVVQWAVAEKLINGVGTELQPKGTATRAQVATVLMNYCENVAK